jgi:hypothetical protein
MGNGSKTLSVKAQKRGHFGDYEIIGIHYQGDDGAPWHITASRRNFTGEINDYWVVGQEFQAMTIVFAFDHGNGNLIRTFGPVDRIKGEEKKAILDAIGQWDKITTPGGSR